MRNNGMLPPIYIDSYRLTQEIFRCTVKFPKEFKFLLGSSLNETSIDLCTTVSKVLHIKNKEEYLDEILTLLEKIKIELRLCADFKLLSCQQQANLAILLEKVNGQTIAWQKSERRKQSVS